MFERLKRLYESGQIDQKGVEKAVAKGWISQEQAAEILAPKDEPNVE